ncbi:MULTISPECIES: hypothetical protein [Mycobacterium]|uniref:Helix-turn-helix domain-containing protein n=1 Tax=Mycobacterium kiyosense TaxID=2871094 RepID=A0A9P3Q8J7_9MYCO|nr:MULTISPECIES: hypothetical protein [Mycobacterium]BDB45396.1 hypothetical protein IWGMT90018_58420 [Mycobacterium kiyosense]BDE16858.1 hypothetical protein MKCMC460_57180 [Mycobacterium sp. 20KCMC460]GLB83059.1 hypothetical protein SRL2020028_23150 [Mycobacterium kiyosense]GLB90666.1 hypothetical protein SRL2020130_34830 [Mycobacterium kiyosense]GLB97431.1 hypothetical protein SRL2020226_42070 [Mycobacterium kiyosense]
MNKNNDHRQVGQRLGVGRSAVFNLWASGELESVTIGRRRFSTDRQLEEYLARLEQASGGDAA